MDVLATMNTQYDTLILAFGILLTRRMFVIKLLINAYRLISNKLAGLIKANWTKLYTRCVSFAPEKILPIEFSANYQLRLYRLVSYENNDGKISAADRR